MSYEPTEADPASSIAAKTRKLITEAGSAADRYQSKLITVAQRLLAEGRARSAHFDPFLCANPGWHLLLELFVAEAHGKRLAADECSALLGTPDRVTARWLALMISEKMVQSSWDTAKSATPTLALTPDALDALYSHLSIVEALEAYPSPPWVNVPTRANARPD